MQEIKKRRIVLASVLKPVNDTRMFEKLGCSLATVYDVHILGTAANTPISQGVTMHGHAPFRRMSLQRFGRVFAVMRKAWRLSPDVFMVCTHELLWAAVVVKLFTGCKVVYDVQENYGRNIRYGMAFPAPLRLLIAAWVRAKEWMTRPFVSWFFLAEAGYENEIRFPGKHVTVLENKAILPAMPSQPRKPFGHAPITLLFSGTLAHTTGVFTAIDLARALHACDARVSLHIIGYCAMPAVLQQLKDTIAQHPFITLTGGDQLVPHPEIVSAIEHADVGIVAYPPNPSTANAIPTKLYEYMGHSLPMLLIDHKPWVERCAPYAAAITFRREALDAPALLAALRHQKFYTAPPQNIDWAAEARRLLPVIAALLR
ncbi:hypothetical protein [Chryseolinea lacunae]|uniref:Glycosyltransferase n=1 Tax=Chryseolinea lacunae TaxID=2801331 RepID=A0ABS1KXZ2_9BACT|nr:hypothetical protein [Chryseolinea lacunae]MBL0744200.1 hypothetical protein [Chryseolinea lacunae]